MTCRHCGIAKARHEFSKNGSGGLRMVCQECRNAAYREWHHARRLDPSHRARRLCSSAKARAAAKGLHFDLTPEWIQARLDAGICEASGLPFDMTQQRGWNTPSLDRERPDLGYVQGNVRMVLFALNAGCGDWGEYRLIEAVRAVLSQRRKRSDELQNRLNQNLRNVLPMRGSIEWRSIWKELDTPSGRRISAHIQSGLRTSGSGFTGWPTPNAGPQNDGDTTWQARRELLKAKHGNGNGFGLTLGQASSLAPWATPASRDWKSNEGSDDFHEARAEQTRGKPLSEQTHSMLGATSSGSPAQTEKPGQLNPAFSRWLQGYPKAWCEAAIAAHRSMRTKARKGGS